MSGLTEMPVTKTNSCEHPFVERYSKQVSAATRYEPACYDGFAQCNICGKILDLDDIPKDAKVREGDILYYNIPEWDDDI